MIYTKECEVCGSTFESSRWNAKTCSDECIKKKGNERKRKQRKRRSESNSIIAKRERGSKKETTKKPKISIADVMRFCAEYEKSTGRYLSFGKAVVMMER